MKRNFIIALSLLIFPMIFNACLSYLKRDIAPATKEYSVRVAMGASERSGGMQKIFTFYLPAGEMPKEFYDE